VRIYNVNARRLERSRREGKQRQALPGVANAPSALSDHPAAAGGTTPQKGARRP
jgi:hypothetical protein